MAPSPIDFTCQAPCWRQRLDNERRNSAASLAAASSPHLSDSDLKPTRSAKTNVGTGSRTIERRRRSTDTKPGLTSRAVKAKPTMT